MTNCNKTYYAQSEWGNKSDWYLLQCSVSYCNVVSQIKQRPLFLESIWKLFMSLSTVAAMKWALGCHSNQHASVTLVARMTDPPDCECHSLRLFFPISDCWSCLFVELVVAFSMARLIMLFLFRWFHTVFGDWLSPSLASVAAVFLLYLAS